MPRGDGGERGARRSSSTSRLEPLPVDSTLHRPAALGARPQVHRAHARGLDKAGFAAGATIPLSQATPEPVEIDEVFNIFDADTRRGAQQSLDGFGSGFAGRGRDLNEAIAELRPAAANDLEPVAANLADPRTQLARFFTRAGRHGRRGGAGGRGAGRAVRQPGHHVHRARRRGAAVPPGVHLRGPAHAGHGDRASSRSSGPSCATRAAFFRELRPGVATLPAAAPSLADAFEVGPGRCPRTPALNRRLAERVRLARRVRRGPARAARRRAPALTRPRRCARRSPSSRPPRPCATTSRCSSATRRASSPRATPTAPASGSSSSPPPQGPNNEGGPSSAPANGPAREQLPARATRTRTPRRPGQTQASARPATRTTLPGARSLGNVPGNQGTVTSGQQGINGQGGGDSE